jgi:hypothetical protein
MEAPFGVVVLEEALAQTRRPAVALVVVRGHTDAVEVHLVVAGQLLGRAERAFHKERDAGLPGAAAELVLTIDGREWIRNAVERRADVGHGAMLAIDRVRR